MITLRKHLLSPVPQTGSCRHKPLPLKPRPPRPAASPVDPQVQAPNSEVPPMSPKREPRFWNREHAPLIMLGVGLVLVMIAAGIVHLDVE